MKLEANHEGVFYDKPLEMGYAMKANQKLPKITEALEKFVKNLYSSGQKTNQKWTPDQIVKEIHKNFPLKEWLKWGQVKGMIGTMKAKVLAQGSKDLDPAQLQQEAEDEIALELAANEISKAEDVLNSTKQWLKSHPLEIKGLDICQLAKDFKTKQKTNMIASASFLDDDIKSTLVEIVQELEIKISSKQPRQLTLAKKITEYVEKKCPLECLFEV